MKKKSRHRLNEMKENEAKRKIDEVDTITHSRSACDLEDAGIYQGPTGLLQGQHNDTGLFLDTRAFTPSAGEPLHSYMYHRCSSSFFDVRRLI